MDIGRFTSAEDYEDFTAKMQAHEQDFKMTVENSSNLW